MDNRAESDGCLPIMTMEIGMGTEEIYPWEEVTFMLCCDNKEPPNLGGCEQQKHEYNSFPEFCDPS